MPVELPNLSVGSTNIIPQAGMCVYVCVYFSILQFSFCVGLYASNCLLPLTVIRSEEDPQ